jgi:hypothetical protein
MIKHAYAYAVFFFSGVALLCYLYDFINPFLAAIMMALTTLSFGLGFAFVCAVFAMVQDLRGRDD